MLTKAIQLIVFDDFVIYKKIYAYSWKYLSSTFNCNLGTDNFFISYLEAKMLIKISIYNKKQI